MNQVLALFDLLFDSLEGNHVLQKRSSLGSVEPERPNRDVLVNMLA